MRKYISAAFAAATAMAAISCNKEIDFDACGQIEATEVTVSAEKNGRIMAFEVKEGDKVEAGQVLGIIDTVQIALQIKELEQRIEGAKSRLVDMKCQSEPDRNQLASLKNDLTRYNNLLQSNAATQKQVKDIEDKIAVLQSQIAAKSQSWERGNQSVLSEMKIYEIQLAQQKDQLSKCHITAPVSGTVLSKYSEEGENVISGKPLFKIAELDDTYVRAYFTTAQLAGLKTGDIVKVTPDDGSYSPKTYEGRLTWISSQSEFTPKNIQTRDERAEMVYAVKISVPNDGYLRLGMYAYIKR